MRWGKRVMTIKHHLNDALLMAYSAGTLPEAFSLVVATHVSMCDECRARLESFDAVGGAMLEDCGAIELSDGALEAVLAGLGAPDARPVAPPAPVAPSVFPAPLRDYVGGDVSAVQWKKVGGGVHQAVLTAEDGASARLLHIPPGVAVPDHGHRGTELTLVLQGAFRDEEGVYARGDVEIADEELSHTPVAEDGEPCICLAATDAPLKFKGLVPRIAQPFIGI